MFARLAGMKLNVQMSEEGKIMATGENALFSGSGRMSARAVLTRTILQKSKEIEALEVLRDELDWESLTTRQEEVLWKFFLNNEVK
jgi:hypothetical protein